MQIGVQRTHFTHDASLGTVNGAPVTTSSPSTNINLGPISLRDYPVRR